MKLARLATLSMLVVAACKSSTPQSTVPLAAPHLQFRKALVVASTDAENRKAVEDAVAAEIERRRPNAEAVASWQAFPDLSKFDDQRFRAFADNHGIDVVVTIVPFVETVVSQRADGSDVAGGEVVGYVGSREVGTLVGRFGVRVIAWDAKTKQPLYAKSSQILIDQLATPRGIAEFTAATVTQGR